MPPPPTKTISATYTAGYTLSASYTAFTIVPAAVVENTSAVAGAIIGPAGTNFTLTNSGLVRETAVGGIGISFANAGTITNASGGTIAVNHLSGLGISLAAGGVVTNAAGGTISGSSGVRITGASGTVRNLGSIDAQTGNADLNSAGVYLTNGGTVINGASGAGTVSAAKINAYAAVVKFGATGTLINYGTLSGQGAATAVQLTTGVVINGPSGATGAQIAVGGASAIEFSGAGTVQNYGTINNANAPDNGAVGARNYYYYGIRLKSGGVINNIGSKSLIEGYIGVYAAGGATVTNAGTIAFTGHDASHPKYAAVWLGTGTNRLIVAPGATFIGTVNGQGGTAGLGTNSLEFASSTVAGTISGLGTQFFNFPRITIDSAARWVLSGSNTLGSGTTLTNNGTLTVTGTLLNNILLSGTSQGVVLGSGGLISNQSAGTITGSAYGILGTSAGTVVNAGIINGGTATGFGVYLKAGGTLTNLASGTISGANDAVQFLANQTNKLVVAPSASFIGRVDGGNTIGAASISTLELASAATTGTLSGLGSSFVNFAVVTIDSGATWTLGGISGISTLSNAGTVNSSGLTFDAGHADRLVIAPSAAFAGTVNGGNTIGAAYASTLELASAASAGTLTGLGSSFVNFATVAIDANATWTLGGTSSGFTTLSNGGTLLGGVTLGSGTFNVTNLAAGTISNTAASASALYASGALTVGNSGAIIDSAAGGIGVNLAGGGTLSNQLNGRITGSSAAVLFGAGHTNRLVIDPSAAFSGKVDGGNTIGASYVSTLELASSASVGTLSGFGTQFVNFAAVTIDAGVRWTLASANNFAGVTLTDSGTLFNSATISGASYGIILAAGGVITNSAAGIITGSVDGISGSAAGTVVNAGSIGGGTSAGIGVYLKAGSVLTNQATGSISGGADAVKFGAGAANKLVVAPSAAFTGTVDGGNTLGAGFVSTLELATAVAAGTLSGIGTKFVNFAQVTIDSTATWTLSGTSSGFTSLANSGKLQGGVTLGSGTFGVSNAISTSTISNTGTSASALYSFSALTLTNSGTIIDSASGGIGVNLAGGGTLTNQATGKITGSSAAVLFGAGHTNKLVVAPSAAFSGRVDGGNTIGASYVSTLELASSASTGTLSGLGTNFVNLAQVTIDSNARWSLASTNTLVSGATLTNSGTLTNAGTFTNAGRITGASAGIFLAASSRLTNQSSGTIVGSVNGVTASISGATIVNAGSIRGGTRGVYVGASGLVSNLAGGTISGTIGVYGKSSAATLTNAGAISGSSIGVYIRVGGTLSNQSGGSISGTTAAVKFHSGYTDRLVIAPSASFSGLVDGGNTIGAASISTMELASAASIGTLNGFGSNYVNFAQITLDANAQWNIIGSGSATALGGATISGFGADTIDITDFAATAASFGSNKLTLSNATGSLALNLVGSFSAGQFAITNDGGSGTDIFAWRIGETIVQRGIVATSETVNAGTMTLFNSGSTAVGSIAVGVPLGTGDFSISNNGTNSYIVVNSAFGTYTSGLTIRNTPATIKSTATVQNTISGPGLADAAGPNWTLVNAGLVTSTGIGISAQQSGTIFNATGGTISATLHSVDMYGNGYVSNASGGVIKGGDYGVWIHGSGTVVNAGSIGGANGQYGVYLTGGGTVINQSGGTLGGPHSVKFLANTTNRLVIAPSATFIGVANGGGGTNTTLELASGATTGTLTGLGSQYINFAQVTVDSAATWALSGTLSGFSTLSNAGNVVNGITLGNGTLAVVNAGSISGGTSTGIGVYLSGGGTLTNQAGGAISGGADAVKFATSHTNRLIIAPSASFTGTVDGGNTIGASSVSTLELASAASAGTLNSLGSQYLHFANITVDAGAAWKLASGSIGSGYTITDGGTLINAATLGSTVTLGSGAVLTNALSGAISTSIYGVVASGTAGGAVTNQTGGVISGGIDAIYFKTGSGAGTVSNSGTITGSSTGFAGINLSGGGSVANSASGKITGAQAGVFIANGTAAVVSNAGSIGASKYEGVWLASGGSVTNATGGTITGGYSTYGAGVYLQNGGTVTNQSSAVVGGLHGVYVLNAAATVVNAGRVAGSGTNIGAGESRTGGGIFLGAGGLVSNQSGGTISGYNGIEAQNSAVTVVNTGVVAGNNTYVTTVGTSVDTGGTYYNPQVYFASLAAGVFLQAGGAITNNSGGGTITGYDGVKAGAYATVVNAGVITGNKTLVTIVSTTVSGGNTSFNTSTDNPGLAAGVYLKAGGLVTNQSGGTISGYTGLKGAGAAVTVVNAGLITGNTTLGNNSGIDLTAGGSVTNQSSGTISGGYYGVQITGARGTVLNLGRIVTHDSGFGRKGVYLADGGLVTNGTAGGTASSAYILGYNGAVVFGATGTDTLINYGTINGNPGSIGVSMATGTVINGPSGATGALIESGLQNSGVLISGVGTVVNYGTINGAAANGQDHVSFGVSVGGSGTIASSISNLGSNALIESYLPIYAAQNATVTNAGTVYATQTFGGAPPANALIFGGGTNRLIIDPGAVFIGTVHGSGSVVLIPGGTTLGGAATSTMELASAASAGTISGLGTQFVGFSQITVDSGASWVLSGSNTIGSGVTLTDGGSLTVTGTLLNNSRLSGSSQALFVAAGGRVTNQSGGLITGGTAGVGGSGAGTLVNAGSITVTTTLGDGVSFAAGGVVTNQAASTISGNVGVYVTGATGTVVNSGAIAGNSTTSTGTGVVLAAGGSVTNAAGGVITGYDGIYNKGSVASTVTNAGSIGGNATGGIGVYLKSGGTLTNQAAGSISGGADAVKFGASHTNRLVVVPSASFTGTVNGGNTIGASFVSTLELASSAAAGTLSGLGTQFINFAQVTIDSGATWTLSGTSSGFATLNNAGKLQSGVTLGSGSFTVSNAATTGTISNTSATASALYASGALSVANAGTIIDTAASGIGINLAGGGTLTNLATGKILGTADAVLLGAGHTNRLVVAPSASFTGTVDGGNTIGATSISTLELASAASAGTLSGLGSQFVNFAKLTIDNSATWTLSGANTLVSGATLTDGGTLVDGGTFTNAGLITGSSYGVILTSGAVLTNSSGGKIFGSLDGVKGTGTVVNAGSITGGTSPGIGVYLSGGGTLTNQAGGAISGYDDAVKFGAGHANRLVVAASASFTGKVDGGNTLAATSVSTLELASSTAAGTLSGLGTQFVNFAQVTIDSGATWTLSGTNSGFVTLNDAGTIAGGLTLGSGTLAVSVQSTAAITGAGYGIIDAGGVLNLVNAGLLSGPGHQGVRLDHGGTVTNQSGGTITGAIGVYATGAAMTVVNNGTISGGPTASASGTVTNIPEGIYLGAGGLVTNQSNGTITGFDGIFAYNTAAAVLNAGVIAGANASFYNTNSGETEFAAGVCLFAGGTVSNQSSGTITGEFGVRAENQAATVINAGTISDRIALYNAGVELEAGGLVTNATSGLITGYVGVALLGSAGTVVNAGRITATGTSIKAAGILLLSNTASSVTNQAGGTISGYFGIESTSGDTVVNDGLIAGNGTSGTGVVFYYGGTLTNLSGGTISGGADAVTFAAGYTNRLVVAPSASFIGTVDGGNTIGASSLSTLELASTASAGTLSGLGSQFVNFAKVTIDSGAQWTLSGTNALASGATLTDSGVLTNAGRLSGAATGIVLTSGAALTNLAGGVIAGSSLGVTAAGAATIVNAGSITGSTDAIKFSAGHTNRLVVYSGASFTGTVDGGNTIGASYASTLELALPGGTLSGLGSQFVNFAQVVIDPSASWTLSGTNTLAAGATLTADDSNLTADGTFTNAGVISNTDGSGVVLADGAALTNQSSGTIKGQVIGVYSTGSASVINAGHIGNVGLNGAGIFLTGGGFVSNESSGVISAPDGIYFGASGTLLNAGTIAASALGVYLAGNGTVVNAGYLAASFGVQALRGGSVTNQSGGTIKGGSYAVSFASGYTNLLAIAPNATFIGTIDGGNGAGATAVSTLELLTGTATGTLAGFGSQFTDFAQITLDAGAHWDIIGGATTTELGSATISGFTIGDTIDLTGFVATSKTFAGNALVLGDGTTNTTLHLQGGFYTSQFHITNDGSGGTDITLQATDLEYGTTVDQPGVVANSETVSNGVMTLFNSSTAVGSIFVGTSLSTGFFTLQPDGTGGTDVIVSTIFGNYTSGVTLQVVNSTIAPTASVSNTATVAAAVLGPSGTTWTLTNQGTVSESASIGDGIKLLSSGTIINAASASVSAAYDGIHLIAGGLVSNQSGGIISGEYGIYARARATVLNAGVITGGSTPASGLYPAGILLNQGGLVSNQSGGVITGYGGVVGVRNAMTVVNYGSIGGSTAASVQSAGVAIYGGGAVSNKSTGVISGTGPGVVMAGVAAAVVNANRITGGTDGVLATTGGIIINQTSGAIGGYNGIHATAAVIVANQGSIGGSTTGTSGGGTGVYLAGGGELFAQGGGTISGHYAVKFHAGTDAHLVLYPNAVFAGTVYGGFTAGSTGASVLELASTTVTGTLSGLGQQFTAFQQVVVDTGAAWTLSGTSTLGAGAYLNLYGTLLGNTTLAPGAAEKVVLHAGGLSVGTLDGGNTIGATATSTLVLASGSTASTLSGLGSHYVNFAQVSVAAGAVWTLNGADTLVSGATLTDSGTLIDSGTFINAGLITGASYGVILSSGAVVSNQSTGTITGTADGVTASGAATVVNVGSVSGGTSSGIGVYLSAGGTLTNQAGGVVSGGADAVKFGASHTNRLVIAPSASFIGTVDGGNTIGSTSISTLELASAASAGTLSGLASKYINFASVVIDSGARWTLSGANSLLNGATLTNSGSLIDSGTFTNAGLITGTSYGVILASGARLTNQSGGTLVGASDGISASGTATVVNAGSIGGGTSSGIGIYLAGGGTLTNLAGGVISGGADAVKFAASHTNRLVIAPSASFTGKVDGGNTIGATSISTLELASGASTGTLNGFGSKYLDFAQVALDPGSQWDIVGSSATTALGGATITGFSYGDIIDITNFAATTRTFSSNKLTLTSGASNITLNLPGTFATQQVVITSDGSSGTDITLQLPVRHYGDTIVATGVVATAATVNAGILTLFNSGNTAVGTIGVGTSLSTGNFLVTNNGTNTNVIIDAVFGTYTTGVTLTTNPTTIISTGVARNTATSGKAVSGATGTTWTLVNAGQIVETANSGIAVGLLAAGTITNATGGTITAGSSHGIGISLAHGGVVTNQATATIAGYQGIFSTGGGGTVVNYGAIVAGTSVAAAAGIFITGGGTLSNASGGVITGNRGIYSGQTAVAVINAGSIGGATSAGIGAYLKGGGTLTNQAGGSISGGSNAVKFGANHTNRLVVAPSASFIGSVDGGNAVGSPTISTLELASAASAGTLSGLGTQFINFARVMVDSGAAWTLTGTNTGFATLSNAGSLQSGLTIGSGSFTVSNQSGGSITNTAASGTALYARGTLVVTNAGSIAGGAGTGIGVYLKGGGTLTNQAGGSISGGTDAVKFGASQTNQLVVGASAAFTGTVDGGNTIGAGFTSTLELASATSAGTLGGLGTQFTNFAYVTIDSGATWTLSGTNNGFATLSNSGSLRSGVTLGSGSLTVSNQSGGIIANAAASGTALYDSGGLAMVNAGSIAGGAGTGIGVYLSGGGTLTNQAGASIGGGSDAVKFGASHTNRLVIAPSASFTGTIDGGNTIGAGSISTLELASSVSIGTLSGFGSKYVNFSQITLDAGAKWDIFGLSSGTALAGATISGFAWTDTIDVTDFIATGSSFSNNQLTLSNSASSITLNLPGTFNTQQFIVTNDGSGGTDITLVPVRLYGDTIVVAGVVASSETVNAGGTLTLFNSGSTAVGSILVGTSLSTGDFLVTNNGTDTNVIVNTVFGTYTSGITLIAGVSTVASTASVNETRSAQPALGAPYGTSVTLTNYGFVHSTSQGVGVDLAAAATVSNQSGGVIYGSTYGIKDLSGALTVVNAGQLSGPNRQAIEAFGGGVVSNLSGGTITGEIFSLQQITVINAGLIRNSSTQYAAIDLIGSAVVTNASGGTMTSSYFGIGLVGGGTVSNQSSAAIIGQVYGLKLQSVPATIFNAGTIAAGSYSSTIAINNVGIEVRAAGVVTNQVGGTLAGFVGLYAIGPAPTIVNYGVISGGTTTAYNSHQSKTVSGAGIFLSNGGNIVNHAGATISGLFGLYERAQYITLSNAGTITGNGSIGIFLYGGGTLINQAGGMISGAVDAVKFNRYRPDLLVIQPGATFSGTVDGGNTIGGPVPSTLELASAFSTGTLSGIGSKYINFAKTTIDSSASWALTGSNSLASGGTITNAGTLNFQSATFTNAGALVNNKSMVLSSSGVTLSSLTGTGSTTLGASSTLDAKGTVASGETIAFSGTYALLELDNPASVLGTISNLGSGDTIDLAGINPSSVSYASGALTFTSAGTQHSIALSVASGHTISIATDNAGGTDVTTLCFGRGTRIATPDGEVSVENLAIGDLVLTMDGTAEPITWIGTSSVHVRPGRRNATTPIIVHKGALGQGVPYADLRLTKGHSLYLDGVLIPVECLVNHRSIVWDDRAREIQIYHIELARHAVLIAQGAPAESYRDDGNRWIFSNAHERRDSSPTVPYAPVLTSGPVVDAVWRYLLDGAGARPGLPTTDDPDLHLLVDNRRINGVLRAGAYQFRLPRRPGNVRIISRAAVPAELGMARDERLLGVALQRLVAWRRGNAVRVVEAAEPLLAEGFHRHEEANGFRWTDGNAVVPAELIDGFTGPFKLSLYIGATCRYPDEGEVSCAA